MPQTITQQDLYTKLQEIISSSLTWNKLTPAQKTLFANPLLLASLGVSSNQKAFNLLKSAPPSFWLDQNPKPPESLNSTVDGALLAQLVEEMNQQNELNDSLKASLSNYSLDQQELIEKLVEIRRSQILQEQLQKNQAVKEIKPEIDSLNPKQNPRSKLVQTAQTVIRSAIAKSPATFTPSQEAAAVKAFVITSLTTNLDITKPQELGLVTSTSLAAANPKYKNPTALAYQQVEQAITPATNQDYQQVTKIIDPQTNIVIDASKLPPSNQIDIQAISRSSQKTINQITSANNDPSDISDPLTLEIKKLRAINENPKANKISQKLTTSLSSQQIDELTHIINQINPTILQLPTPAAQKATALLQETTPKNSILSPSTAKLYGQGLTPKTWAELYQNARIQELVSPRQAYIINQQLKTLNQSQLGKEIKPQLLTGFTRRFQTFTNKLTSRLPRGFTKPLNFIFHPFRSIKGWFAKKAGQYLGKKIYKAFAKKITNKTARLIAKTLLRQGLKKGTKFLIKLGLKAGIHLAAESVNTLAPGVGFVLDAILTVGMFIIEKTIGFVYNGIQNVAQSIWGEKIKARDLLALPIMAAAGIASLASVLRSAKLATMAASKSAAAAITVSVAAGIFIYITALAVAPLISTIAQLESQPSSSYSITAPSGPIPPGCPSGWPVNSGYITQGPQTLSTHFLTEAIDIGAGLGTPIYSTHPGRAIAVEGSGPYGNYVDVYGVCKGINFITRYAHMPFVSFYGERLVSSGEQIGVVDSTGNSTGNHLHYEIRAGALGDINQFLPKHVPPGCIEYSQCQVDIP